MARVGTSQDVVYSKRGFLNKLAMLFDPLQMLVPFTIRARMALQEAWLLGLDWDDEFPGDLKKTCQEWFSQLLELSGVQVPRCYRVNEKRVAATSIHTIMDASLLAYAAVSYVRHEYERKNSSEVGAYGGSVGSEIGKESVRAVRHSL